MTLLIWMLQISTRQDSDLTGSHNDITAVTVHNAGPDTDPVDIESILVCSNPDFSVDSDLTLVPFFLLSILHVTRSRRTITD
jgi:hypothetical protein